jgi:hypothetical protein
MERIQINGEWYIKEKTSELVEPVELDPTHIEQLVYETNKYCFVVSRIFKYDDIIFYEGVSIEFTDKRYPREEWKTEYWDNDSFIIGVYENDESCIEDALESMDQEGITTLQQIVKQLIEKEWLTIPTQDKAH